MIVLVCQCGSTRTASGGSAGTLVPGATQRCGKCPRWCPGGSWTVEHRPMVPPAGRKGLERHLGASQSLPGPESADSRTRQPPHGTRSALDGVQVARGRPNTHRWSPRVAVRAFERHLGLLRAFSACPARESTGWCRSPATRLGAAAGSVGQLGRKRP